MNGYYYVNNESSRKLVSRIVLNVMNDAGCNIKENNIHDLDPEEVRDILENKPSLCLIEANFVTDGMEFSWLDFIQNNHKIFCYVFFATNSTCLETARRECQSMSNVMIIEKPIKKPDILKFYKKHLEDLGILVPAPSKKSAEKLAQAVAHGII